MILPLLILLNICCEIRAIALHPAYRFHQSKETLETISHIISAQKKGAYLRFGDGDLVLAHGKKDLYQNASKKLQTEMQKALAMNGPTILKTLPLHCKEFGGWEPYMHKNLYHEWPLAYSVNFYQKAIPFWGAPITDVYSMVALCYTAIHHEKASISFLKKMRKAPSVILIGNKNIPPEMRHQLFGINDFIPTPERNAFNEIDRIEQEAIRLLGNKKSYCLVVIAMGCSGRILAKRLWPQVENIFLFDFGSLMDLLCGWKTRAWMDHFSFDQKAFLQKLNDQ